MFCIRCANVPFGNCAHELYYITMKLFTVVLYIILTNLSLITGEIFNAGINRSPSAYLNNPAAERSKYKSDVDQEMTLLKFIDNEWGPVGSFNWFATHGTSMGRTNSLISGDNKGAAARIMEDWFDQNNSESTSSAVSKTIKIPRRVSNIIPIVNDNRKYSNKFWLSS